MSDKNMEELINKHIMGKLKIGKEGIIYMPELNCAFFSNDVVDTFSLHLFNIHDWLIDKTGNEYIIVFSDGIKVKYVDGEFNHIIDFVSNNPFNSGYYE